MAISIKSKNTIQFIGYSFVSLGRNVFTNNFIEEDSALENCRTPGRLTFPGEKTCTHFPKNHLTLIQDFYLK